MQKNTEMKKNWLATIHIAKTWLNMTDDTYRAMLKTRYGVNSARDLTAAQGNDLMDYLRSLGFTPPAKKRRCTFCAPRPPREAIPENVIYPASQAQLATIRRLRNDIRWRTENGFKGWLKRYFKISSIQTSIEASMVITALKGLWRNQHNCRCSLVTGRLKKVMS